MQRDEGRYSCPAALATVSLAPEAVCDLIFRACDESPRLIRLLRTSCMSSAICDLRHAIVYVSRERLAAPFRDIGLALNRDHSTVIYNYRIASAMYKRDPSFKAMCERIAS